MGGDRSFVRQPGADLEVLGRLQVLVRRVNPTADSGASTVTGERWTQCVYLLEVAR